MSSVLSCELNIFITDLVFLANQHHGGEPYLRNGRSFNYSKIFQNFIEPDVSLLWSQEPSTGPYPEPD
jgi:hypothetical protein